MDPLDPLHTIFPLDLCLEFAMYIPIELMKVCITDCPGSNGRLTAEYQRRTNLVKMIQALLPFMDEDQNESITTAARTFYFPFNGLDYDTAYTRLVLQFIVGFDIFIAPEDIVDHITVAFLQSLMQIIDCHRNGNSIIVLMDRILKSMRPNETIKKALKRLKVDAVVNFDVTLEVYFDAGGRHKEHVALYCKSANKGFKDLFRFKADVAEVFKLMGYGMERIGRVSYMHLLYLRKMVIKCSQ